MIVITPVCKNGKNLLMFRFDNQYEEEAILLLAHKKIGEITTGEGMGFAELIEENRDDV